MRVAVAGAGIAGLSTAIALGARGLQVDVYERAPELREIGAGIQLAPNAMRVLDALGVTRELAGRLSEPGALVVRDGRNGGELARVPLGPTARTRYGAPYCTLTRADLQAGLIAAARSYSSIALHLDAPVHAVRAGETDVAFRAGEDERTADILVAADGVHSKIRAEHFRHPPAKSLGHTAWRAILPFAEVPEAIARNDVVLWLGAGTHMVHYPVGGATSQSGGALNVVLIGVDRPAPPLAAYGALARRLIDAVPEWRTSQLFEADASRSWARGRVLLIGDAAHAMAPSAAQGGAQAIEDAQTLASLLADDTSRPALALARLQGLRQARVDRIARLTARNLHSYEMVGFAAVLRNSLLRALPARLLLSQLDWLFSGGRK